MFNGLGCSLTNLPHLSNAQTRSISAENPHGEKGHGGMSTDGVSTLHAADLGQGWKVNPYVYIEGGQTVELADIIGSGAIQHLWMAGTATFRFLILRIYWEDSKAPSVECPLSDFFAAAFHELGSFIGAPEAYNHIQISSLAVCVNSRCAYNCYWEMPFHKHCRITIENLSSKQAVLFYQIDYTLTEVPDDYGYFHAQFRRVNPLPYKSVYTILDGVRGKGQYVGTYMAWGSNNSGWWGEGEIKIYIDGDADFPTICGTGTEDYFCGAWCFRSGNNYLPFTSPYSGFLPATNDHMYLSQKRFGLYRWHINDPIRFETDLKITIQALGWRTAESGYLPLQDDIASVAFWYQTLPAAPFPPLPKKERLEII